MKRGAGRERARSTCGTGFQPAGDASDWPAASKDTQRIGGQAFINILVNLQMFPSKGMTLPLISYGGSSTIAMGITVGLLLAITRRNPFLKRETPGLKALLERKEDPA